MKNIQLRLRKDTSINIIINKGIASQLKSVLPKNANFFILTDQNIYNYYGELLEKQLQDYKYNIILCPNGESAKDFDYIKNFYSDLIEMGCNRRSCLIAFGGGVIGDITGFIAATFMRGIQYINIPTTLLGMVDSSIGGKTGINLPSGKNLIGSIYHPEKIIIDPDLLNTLPEREYHSGMAEIIKYSLILDKDLFVKLENSLEQLLSANQTLDYLNEIISTCVQLKVNIVEEDESDNNIRNILNFGHTIGHAFETYFEYVKINHGEAVAYGMLYASKLSNVHGNLSEKELERIYGIIKKLNLPEIKNIDIEKILSFIKYDKKNTSQGLNFILLNEIGKACISQNISYNDIEMVLTENEYISY